MLNVRGELFYVGKAKCLRTRLLSYFRAKSRGPKASRIVKQTRALVWEAATSEFAALLRELELIQRWRPRFNVHGQPHRRRRVYVCIGRPPAPYVYLSAKIPASGSTCYGPVPAGDTAREAVRRINDAFRLRDCPQAQDMVFADQRELFPLDLAAGCIRYEINACLGPCAAAVTRTAYMARVRAARAFLEEADLSLLNDLQRDMQAASAALAFERAAALRDRHYALSWLHRCLDRLRRARERAPWVYPVRGVDGSETWYLIRGGHVVEARPAPEYVAGRRAVAAQLRRLGRAANAAGPVSPDELDGVLMVVAWFYRHPEESARGMDAASLV
jgi:excinuclease ABC subunit C